MMEDERLTPVRCGCGGEAEVVKHTFHDASPCYGVTCRKCGSASWHGFDNEAEAIEAWNRAMRRAEECSAVERTAKVDGAGFGLIGKCHDCGEWITSSKWKFCPSCGARLEWE